MDDFSALAEAMREKLVARRRDLHQHPELAFEEVRTAGLVADALRNLGMEVQTGVGRTGVVGILEGSLPGPTVLLRADMDALPIAEETGLEYQSQSPGKMHACGHDGHVSIALGVAELMAERRDQMAGRLKFVFQPAEEVAAGARAMIADGVLADPHPDVSLGLHLWNSMPLGAIGAPDGPMMAGASMFTIRIVGKGGHGAAPHETLDPIVCASHLVTQLQTIVSRNVNPFDTAVISVTQFHGGTANNVIPEDVTLGGTVRTFRQGVRDHVVARMARMIDQTCAAMGCESTFEIRHVTEAVDNHPAVGSKVRPLIEALPGITKLDMSAQTMGSEDMSLLMHDVPGMYFLVGAADPTAATYYGHHHPRFNFDEDALPLGVALLATAAGAYLFQGS